MQTTLCATFTRDERKHTYFTFIFSIATCAGAACVCDYNLDICRSFEPHLHRIIFKVSRPISHTRPIATKNATLILDRGNYFVEYKFPHIESAARRQMAQHPKLTNKTIFENTIKFSLSTPNANDSHFQRICIFHFHTPSTIDHHRMHSFIHCACVCVRNVDHLWSWEPPAAMYLVPK